MGNKHVIKACDFGSEWVEIYSGESDFEALDKFKEAKQSFDRVSWDWTEEVRR
jgi:hypothetical protein